MFIKLLDDYAISVNKKNEYRLLTSKELHMLTVESISQQFKKSSSILVQQNHKEYKLDVLLDMKLPN